ncbi:MAG TPA: hydroxyisourate hydrolase [Burkholderiales bacterium]|nr:hydroxyisourate hydrolase [Burkholderiales bacterium]
MPGISIHVVDVSRGIVAAGMHVELRHADGRVLASGPTNTKGLLDHPALASTFESGNYEAVFQVSAYYRRQFGIVLPDVPFLDVVHYRFGVSDGQQHYHLPFKCTPWGYSCFRGGA